MSAGWRKRVVAAPGHSTISVDVVTIAEAERIVRAA
jgi:hypothetical protein